MAERSPNYPTIPLGEAVDLVKKFYEAEGRTSVDNESAAKAIGHTVVSGTSRTKISALKHYNLLQGRGDKISITSLGLRVVHPDDESDYANALKEAARSPLIFSALLESHTEASDNAIVAFLVKTKNFTNEGARQVAKSFRDTISFAKLAAGTHTPDERRSDDGGGKDAGMQTQTQQQDQPVFGDGVLMLSVPYRGVSLNVRVEVKGQGLTRDHVAKVRKYLELAEEDLSQGPDQDRPSPGRALITYRPANPDDPSEE